MTLGGAATRPRFGSSEDALLKRFRSGGYGVRYTEEDAVHRIVAPVDRGNGNTVVGLVVIREQRIMYAEFDRQVYPWWGRGTLAPEYAEALERLLAAALEGRRK